MNAHTAVFQSDTAHWSAVFSLFMGVTCLIAAEFMPVSLLTPMARDLAVTEGMAGQTVTAVGVFAVLTSLLLSPLTRGMDRRRILLAFSLLLIVSNLLVALAPNYYVLLAGRGLLGICVGGFWSMAPAVTLQLVPAKDLPRALSIVYAGVSVATILSLPLASYLGHLLGWRNVFLLTSLLGGVMYAWQFAVIPPLPSRPGNSFSNMFALLRRNWVLAGMGGTISVTAAITSFSPISDRFWSMISRFNPPRCPQCSWPSASPTASAPWPPVLFWANGSGPPCSACTSRLPLWQSCCFTCRTAR